MFKLRTWEEIENLFASRLIANYPNLKFTTESNMYKIMLPIMEEVQRIEERQQSYIDKNNYRKAEGYDLDLYLNDKNFPRKNESKSKGFLITKNSIPNTSALAYTIKFDDNRGHTFVNTEPFAVDSTGYAKFAIEAEEYGKASNVEAGKITAIRTPIVGLLTVSNEEPTTGGSDRENDFEYRLRWEKTKNADSFWNTDGIASEINAVNGVISCKVLENATDKDINVGGMIMPSCSRRYYVDGGASIDIANAIFKKTDRALRETGTEHVKIKDTQGEERDVYFSRPTYVKVYHKIVLDGYVNTTEVIPVIEDYIKKSHINQTLTSFTLVPEVRESVDTSEVINLEVHFSRDNVNFFSSLKMDVFEKAVL